MSTCKYWELCSGYDPSAITCVECSDNERNYCGNFRKFEEVEE